MTDKQLLNDAVGLLSRLIATPSTSRQENDAADLMEVHMKELGLCPKRHANNVWAVCPDYDEHRPTLLLNAHIDTVKPSKSWTKDPFTPTLEDGKLYGLGANDCGGGLVSLLESYCVAAKMERNFNVIYLASAEEEVSGDGGVAAVLPLLPKIDAAIVGEPTGMQPAIAEKGLMVVELTMHGKSGHAARQEGVNAIYGVLKDLEWISQYKFERISPLLGPTIMNATMINAGTQHNVVPDTCNIVVDVRVNERYTLQEVFDIIRRHVKSEARARSMRLAPSHMEPTHPLVATCVEMGMTPYGSPTLSDQALMPFPSIKLGPGDSARSHTADEYVGIDEIGHAIQTYVSLFKKLRL